MPDPSVWQEEFPFESRIALPEGVQPLPVRRAPERSSEPPRPADFHAPSPEPHFPGIFSLASEPNGAACEVHLLQEEEFPDAEGDVPDVLPDMILRSREGCENEERHLVEADSFQCFDVLRDCLRRVRREPEDVASVAGDTVLVIPRAHLGIVPDLVLALPRCIQGFLPDG